MTKINKILHDFNIDTPDKMGGTDKSTIHSYDIVYENILSDYINKEGNLLEIGIKHGGSILLWNQFLNKFKIYGIDCDDLIHENISNYIKNYKEKIHLEFRDAYTQESVNILKQKCTEGFDIIIDDGPHTEESQIKAIGLYLELLKENGTLIIEDVADFNFTKKLESITPKSKLYHYETKVYDLRDVKGRYDDIMFTIKKIPRKTKNTKIVMISMFKNEATTIRRMLESCYQHIDYWILQNNGSTDGTPEVVKEFFKDKNIPGFIYEVEEGWVSFGWNRDHLLQTCLNTDHDCDWIMKMDCDEYLEVDEDFDWSYFDNKEIQSFHVTAQNPGCIYYRAWIWNAKLPWKFYHDVAHECIYLNDGVTGEGFQVTDLPRSFRMCGTNEGESYTVRTKYISDALKLEEKLIREETMLTDRYHFWYVGKSYMDCFRGDFYPLGDHHSKEFARRAIFYFERYIDFVHEGGKLQRGINEMCYYATFCIGECYKFLGDIEKALYYFKDAESFCPVRNEHLVHLAHTYNDLGQYDKMLEVTTLLINPERKLPFPNYYFLIDTNLYFDSGHVPKHLHNQALAKVNKSSNEKSIDSFAVQIQTKPRLWIVDNFYDDPYAVREFALKQEFQENLNYYKGSRSTQQFIVPGTKEAFEKIIGKKITNWTETHGMCGRFQYCTAQDDLVYHCDSQTLAGMVYLTPDAPYSCGTSLFAHKKTGLRNENDFNNVDVFGETGFYDRSKFELVDTAGNVFNRLVLFDAKCIHSANEYFGTNITNGRLFHLFFFD